MVCLVFRGLFPHNGRRRRGAWEFGHLASLLLILSPQVWHTTVPVWALLLAAFLPALYVLPSGFIFAMTGQGVSVYPLEILISLLNSLDLNQSAGSNRPGYALGWQSRCKHGVYDQVHHFACEH